MGVSPGASRGKKLVPLVPDGGWGWVVVVGSFLLHVFADGFVYSFGVMIEKIIVDFKASNSSASIILSLLTGMTLGCGPIASAITNKYGCRTTTIAGALIGATGSLLSYFAQSVTHLVISVGLIMGLGFGLMYCPAIVVVTMYFERWRALATGLAVCGAGFGTLIFSPVNAYMIDEFGWRSVFLLFTGCILSCVLFGATFRPLQFVEVDENEESEEETLREKTDSPSPAAVDFIDVEKSEHHPQNGEPTSPLLAPPESAGDKLRSVSHSNLTEQPNGGIRSALSVGNVNNKSPRGRTISQGSGYLEAKDVFYTGSITNVQEFQDNPNRIRDESDSSVASLGGSSSRHGATSHAGVQDQHMAPLKEAEDEKDSSPEGSPSHKAGEPRRRGVRPFLRTLARMLNVSLLKEPTYVIFCVSNLLTSVGFNSPLLFLPPHAVQIGQTAAQGSLVLSCFGGLNTFGRVFFGLISDHKFPLPNGWGDDTARNRLVTYNLSLIICGAITVFCFMFRSFPALATFGGLFGFTIASYICLTSVILVDLLGLEKLTNAFGLLLLFQGVGTVFGPPLAGLLADYTGNYDLTFVFCGLSLLVSGLMLFAIPFVRQSDTAPARTGQKAKAPAGH